MRISDWSSDVCSSDLGLYQVEDFPVFDKSFEDQFSSWECRASAGRVPAITQVCRSAIKLAGPALLETRSADASRPRPPVREFAPRTKHIRAPMQIGRASCRERVCRVV